MADKVSEYLGRLPQDVDDLNQALRQSNELVEQFLNKSKNVRLDLGKGNSLTETIKQTRELATAQKELAAAEKQRETTIVRRAVQGQIQQDKDAKKALDDYIKSVKDGKKELDRMQAAFEKREQARARREGIRMEREERARLNAEIKECQRRSKELDQQIKELEKSTLREAAAAERAANAYLKLNDEHIIAVRTAQQLGAQYGTMDDRFIAASTAANVMGDKLKAIDAQLGNHHRNIGNYSSAWNGLNNSVTQMVRELPSAAMGFGTFMLAISNNYPILIDNIKQTVAENKKLIAQGKPTQSVFKQIAGAVLSWQTALTVGITLLVMYGDKLWDMVTRAKEAINLNKMIAEKAAESYAKVAVEMEMWSKKMFAATTTVSEKNQIVKEINDTYGDNIGKLKGIADAEDFLINKSKAFIQVMYLRAQAVAAMEVAMDETKKQLIALTKPIEEYAGAFDKIGAFIRNPLAVNELTMQRALLHANEELTRSEKILDLAKQRYQEWGDEARKIAVENGFTFEKEDKKREQSVRNLYKKLNELQEQTLNNQRELEKKNQEAIIAGNEAIMNNEKESFEVRLEALKTYEEDSLKLIEGDAELQKNIARQKTLNAISEFELREKNLQKRQQFTLAAQQQLESELALIESDASLKRVELQNAAGAKSIAILISQLDEETRLRLEAFNKQQDDLNTAEQAEINGLVTQLQHKSITIEEYERKVQQVRAKYQLESLNSTVTYLEAELARADIATDKKIELENKLAAAKLAIQKAGNDKIIEDEKRMAAKIKEVRQTLFDVTKSLAASAFESQKQKLDAEATEIDKDKNRKIEAINAEQITAVQKEEKIAIAEAQAQARREQLEARQREIQIRQAKFNKALSISEIIAETAVAVIRALGSKPYTPANIGLAAATGLIGAAQLAAAIASPIPQYAEGTKDHKGGLAVVGDGGRQEVAVLPSGKAMLTPATGTLLSLPKHTQVFPSVEDYIAATQGFMTVSQLEKADDRWLAQAMQEGLEKQTTKIVNAIKNSPKITLVSRPSINRGYGHNQFKA